jgi:hypothetical protein
MREIDMIKYALVHAIISALAIILGIALAQYLVNENEKAFVAQCMIDFNESVLQKECMVRMAL